MTIRIALVGNPNCGKTTMFNSLTGSKQYVGNWPGVTVEKKAGKLKKHNDVEIIDLPGIYSLSPYTLEEVVSRNFLLNETPDAIINIVDASNIERNLYLTTQLAEMGLPVVIALNMMDVVEKKGDKIDIKGLSKKLNCPIIEASALKDRGCVEIAEKAIEIATNKSNIQRGYKFSSSVEEALEKIENLLKNVDGINNYRWNAVKVFEKDEKAIEKLALSTKILEGVNTIINETEKELDDDTESIIANERYNFVEKALKGNYDKRSANKQSISDKVDNIVTNKFLAIPIFAAIMFLVYYVSITTIGTWATDWTNDTLFGEMILPATQNLLTSMGTAEWLNSLIVDGIISGVGSVLGFVPQMVVLFFLLAILEDCGYMSRIAFIMDKVFRKFGLSGKSFIPMLIGSGCSVPGIMASRTIESESDRRITIVTTSFIPCGAKLPVIALIAGSLFGGAAWIAPFAYFIGIIAIVMSGLILKKFKSFSGDVTPFVMELPPYHLPALKNVVTHTWDRAKSFIMKAGTVIFLSCGLIWFLSTFNFKLEMVDTSHSILASLGSLLAPVFTPLGFGNWESTVATLTGLVAKENIVGTFGVLFGAGEVAENGVQVWNMLQASFTQAAALSFLMFNLLAAPCFAAIGAIRREMGNGKLTLMAVGYQTGFAYAVAFVMYQLTLLFTGNGFNIMTILALLVIAALLFLMFRPGKKEDNKKVVVKGEMQLNL